MYFKVFADKIDNLYQKADNAENFASKYLVVVQKTYKSVFCNKSLAWAENPKLIVNFREKLISNSKGKIPEALAEMISFLIINETFSESKIESYLKIIDMIYGELKQDLKTPMDGSEKYQPEKYDEDKILITLQVMKKFQFILGREEKKENNLYGGSFADFAQTLELFVEKESVGQCLPIAVSTMFLNFFDVPAKVVALSAYDRGAVGLHVKTAIEVINNEGKKEFCFFDASARYSRVGNIFNEQNGKKYIEKQGDFYEFNHEIASFENIVAEMVARHYYTHSDQYLNIDYMRKIIPWDYKYNNANITYKGFQLMFQKIQKVLQNGKIPKDTDVEKLLDYGHILWTSYKNNLQYISIIMDDLPMYASFIEYFILERKQKFKKKDIYMLDYKEMKLFN